MPKQSQLKQRLLTLAGISAETCHIYYIYYYIYYLMESRKPNYIFAKLYIFSWSRTQSSNRCYQSASCRGSLLLVKLYFSIVISQETITFFLSLKGIYMYPYQKSDHIIGV